MYNVVLVNTMCYITVKVLSWYINYYTDLYISLSLSISLSLYIYILSIELEDEVVLHARGVLAAQVVDNLSK